MNDALGVAAAGWGVLMAISPLLQIRRMMARQSSADVSIAYLVVLEFGFLLWVGYGLSLGNPVILLPNTVAATRLSKTKVTSTSIKVKPRCRSCSSGCGQ